MDALKTHHASEPFYIPLVAQVQDKLRQHIQDGGIPTISLVQKKGAGPLLTLEPWLVMEADWAPFWEARPRDYHAGSGRTKLSEAELRLAGVLRLYWCASPKCQGQD